MKITSHTSAITTTRPTSNGDLTRRAVTLSVAGAFTCVALSLTTAHADNVTAEGDGASSYSRDIDDVVAARKMLMARDYVELGVARSGPATEDTCHIPESLDRWSRRLIAVQDCSSAHIVPPDFSTLLPYGEPVRGAVGHCGRHVLHQAPNGSDLPVSAWYTPTSC